MGEKSQGSSLEGHRSGQSNRPMTKPAHALSHEEVSHEQGTDVDNGLSHAEAQKRLEEIGPNILGDSEAVNPVKIFLNQIANAMTLVLLLAMAVSFGIRSWIEGGVIAGVIAINVTVGFMQEFKAAKTMDSLRSLSSPTANVIRDGQAKTIPTREVVPGDLVELKTGDTVPADLRVVDAMNLETDEALLTGESLPVEKRPNEVFDEDTGPGDRLNVAYSSSTVTKGRGRGVVFATAMCTEVGAIAAELRKKGSKTRPVKRNQKGSAGPHRYAQAGALTLWDAAGRFLGLNVGTPLQRKLSKLASLLFIIACICAVIVLAANQWAQYPSIIADPNDPSNPEQEVAIYAVATGLSMIPASLVVVLTITMSAGTKRMVERNVIVRKMDALEALGSVTDICSDKTGTITQGKMVAKKAWIPAKGTYSVGETNEAFNPSRGDLQFDKRSPANMSSADDDSAEAQAADTLLHDNEDLEEFLKVASMANLATVYQNGEGWVARGDPTEIAIQVFATRFSWNRRRATLGENPRWKQLAEFPFDSDVKKMSVIYRNEHSKQNFVFTKGAVERIINSCSRIHWPGEGMIAMTDKHRAQILENMEAIAALGLRCLALASRDFEQDMQADDHELPERETIERDLTFRGLIGLYDPPRPESAGAVRACHNAGIAVHMLTGDHPGTARAIAAQVGILPARMEAYSKSIADSMVMTASQFDKLSDDQIDRLPILPLVIARCAPQTKVRMIDALHRRGKFCAMTGDGVNDSPSLKRADVGIAMGQSGSDVAKDASDIILTDDNFASILNAIEEGRRMFDNIQKFILHVLGLNVAQACVLLIGLYFKDTRGLSVFPLSPVEIMFIIMITSGFPDMGLGFERASPDVLNRPPVPLRTGIFQWEILVDMLFYGLWIAALVLGDFVLVVWGFEGGWEALGNNCNASYSPQCDVVFRARGTAFAALTWFALFMAWELIDMRRSFFRMQPGSKLYLTQWMHDIWRNQFLFWSVILGFVLMFPVLYIPVINKQVFVHAGISWEWGIVFVSTLLFFLGAETWKFGKRVFFRWHDRKTEGMSWKKMDLESKAFGQWLVESESDSEALTKEG